MTFLDLMNKLGSYVNQPDSDLTASEIGLFTVLALELNKKRDSNNQIDRTQVSIGNFLMCGLLNISKTKLWKSRNRLKQLGIIDFKNGKRKGSYTTYFIGQAFTIRTQTRTQTRTQEETQTRTRIKSKELRDKNEDIKENSKKKNESDFFQSIVDVYNDICKSLPRVKKLTDDRIKKLKKVTKTISTLEEWTEIFKEAENTPFLKGQSKPRPGKEPWVANFDWFIKNDTNGIKVLERSYDWMSQKKEVPNGFSRSSRKPNEADRIKNPSGESTNYDELEELLVCKSD